MNQKTFVLPQSVKLALARIQLIVSAAESYQLVMTAALDYSAALKNHYHIRITDGRQTVRDDEGRSVLHQTVHTVLDVTLGTCIDRARSLVEHEDRRL